MASKRCPTYGFGSSVITTNWGVQSFSGIQKTRKGLNIGLEKGRVESHDRLELLFLEELTMLAPVLSSTPPHADSLVTIGKILKPFGIRGEVKVESLSDVPGRFDGLQTVFLTLPSEAIRPEETTVTQVREVNPGYLMKFSAFSTPEEAAPYRGAWIQIPTNPDLPRNPDIFYQFELIGLRVEDPDGRQMGAVEEILEYPQHHLLVVRNEEKEFLIPVNRKTIEKIDLDKHYLRLASKEWWDIHHAL